MEKPDTTEFNLWLAKNSIKILVAVLVVGMTIGIGGNKLIGIFIDSQTTEQFDSVNNRFESLNDRVTRDEQTIEALTKATQELPNQIADVKIQQATISSQLVAVINELGRLQTQFDDAFAPNARRRHSDDETPAVVPTTEKK